MLSKKVLLHLCFRLLGLVEDVGEMTSSAVLTVKVGSHEDAGSTFLIGTLAAKAGDLAILVNLKQSE